MPVPTQAVEILPLESEALTESGTPPESETREQTEVCKRLETEAQLSSQKLLSGSKALLAPQLSTACSATTRFQICKAALDLCTTKAISIEV